MSDILNKVRNEVANLGGSELDAVENMPALQALWDQMQDLRNEMNVAKKSAAEEAAKPYMELITEIEKRYALILKMTN